MKKYINLPVLFLLLVVAILAFFLLRKSNTQTKYDSSAIMEKISYVKDLSLVKYNYSGVISYKDAMKFMNMQVPLTEKSFLIRYNGYVKAGIDMSNAHVTVSGKSVKVTLPKPTIQEIVIDEKSIQVFDETMNVFNPTKIADYQKAIVGEKNKITQDALSKGILTESSDQAHKFITSLLKELRFEKVEIAEAESLTLPTTGDK
ncbi:MAG: DUF4230 domain-containing protein [Porphyromonadaceae bacterium]|nr:DUF4230 domain-containing protein [Porphyromonadaceae bacterium]